MKEVLKYITSIKAHIEYVKRLLLKRKIKSKYNDIVGIK